MPKAAGLADEIRKAVGLDAELIKGSGGVFDVVANGKLIYSKSKTGRFPEHREVLDAISAMKG